MIVQEPDCFPSPATLAPGSLSPLSFYPPYKKMHRGVMERLIRYKR
jgi:hypothetical protein